MEEILAKSIRRAKYIRRERRERAWPQQQLADIAGVNLRTVQRVEKDGAASFETLKGIAIAFDVDVKDLESPPTIKEVKNLHKRVYLMPRISSGNELSKVVVNSEQFQFEHDEANDLRAINAMKDLLNLLKEDVIRLYDADPLRRLDIEQEMSKEIKGLETYGFYLFGIKRSVPIVGQENRMKVAMTTLFLSHANSRKIVANKDSLMMIPAVLSETAK